MTYIISTYTNIINILYNNSQYSYSTEFINVSSLMGFPSPANESMYGITLLLSSIEISLLFVFMIVVMIMLYAIDLFHHKSNSQVRNFEKSIESTLDVLFVIFPTILIIFILVPSLGIIYNTEFTPETAFSIKVVGHQWYWTYEYDICLSNNALYGLIDYNTIKIQYDSLLNTQSEFNRLLTVDRRLVTPVNTPIEVCVTSHDVIHSWAIPQLGVKYDAVPGKIISFVLIANMIGVYNGQCSELRGVNHGFMPIEVQVVSLKEFYLWMSETSALRHININKLLDLINNDNITQYNEFSKGSILFNILDCEDNKIRYKQYI